MDLRKEIKLSDLVPKRKPRKSGTKAEAKKAKRAGKAPTTQAGAFVGAHPDSALERLATAYVRSYLRRVAR